MNNEQSIIFKECIHIIIDVILIKFKYTSKQLDIL